MRIATIILCFIAVATIAATFAGGIEDSASPRNRTYWIGTIAYWIVTVMLAFEMVAGGIWDLLHIEYVRVILTHLGYPMYLLTIIGLWKIPCALTVLAPRLLRLKEWAYAGALFNYTGAAASHFLVGDGPNKWGSPLVFAGLAIASWALRPRIRRLAPAGPAADARPVTWVVPIVIAAAMLALSFASLPKGPPAP